MLVLAAPSADFTGPEEQAITNFVQAGGGLMFLGVRNLNTHINTLIGQWGMQFNNTLIESPLQPSTPQNFPLTTFASHPALGSNPAFQVNWGGSLTVTQGATVLGQTSAAEWESVSGQTTQQAGDPHGPFVIIAAAQPGAGPVLAMSDNAFDDYILQYSPDFLNINLFLSASAWLTAALNPTPSPPPPAFLLCDVNHTGNIDVADVQFEMNQALGIMSGANALNGDGAVTVVDVQIVADAALGFPCTAK